MMLRLAVGVTVLAVAGYVVLVGYVLAHLDSWTTGCPT